MNKKRYRKRSKFIVKQKYCFIPSSPNSDGKLICVNPGDVGEVLRTDHTGGIHMRFKKGKKVYHDYTDSTYLARKLRKLSSKKPNDQKKISKYLDE